MNTARLLPMLFLLFSMQFYAQHENMKEKREQIKALKIAFFSSELNFTTTEAEKFWPLYNAFKESEFQLKHQKNNFFKKKSKEGTLDKITEKEATLFLEQIAEAEEELFLLRKKFAQNLLLIIPASKIIKFRKTEQDFNRKLLHQYRNKTSKQ